MIGIGVLAVAGIGLYMWKRRKYGETTETKSNAIGVRNPRIQTNTNNCACYDERGVIISYDCCKKATSSNAVGSVGLGVNRISAPFYSSIISKEPNCPKGTTFLPCCGCVSNEDLKRDSGTSNY